MKRTIAELVALALAAVEAEDIEAADAVLAEAAETLTLEEWAEFEALTA